MHHDTSFQLAKEKKQPHIKYFEVFHDLG
jgi:hypothetical protein